MTYSQPVALNARTTYGLNTSADNNYGLGRNFVSTRALSRSQKASNAAPSWWWLVAIIVLWKVL